MATNLKEMCNGIMAEKQHRVSSAIVLEMAYASGQHRQALIATSAILFVFILIINGCFAYVKGKSNHD